jgi:hypothetical protein
MPLFGIDVSTEVVFVRGRRVIPAINNAVSNLKNYRRTYHGSQRSEPADVEPPSVPFEKAGLLCV